MSVPVTMPDPRPDNLTFHYLKNPNEDSALGREWSFDLENKLGGAGSTAVYRCRKGEDESFTTKVFLMGSAGLYKNEVTAFELIKLNNVPHMVEVLGNGYTSAGYHFNRPVIVERLVEGDNVLGQVTKDPNSLNGAYKIIILRQYLETLEGLIGAGLVETDPKVENIFWNPSEVAITIVDPAQCMYVGSKNEAASRVKESLFRSRNPSYFDSTGSRRAEPLPYRRLNAPPWLSSSYSYMMAN